jgi:uncharacterized protein (DUF1778 family)
VSKFVVGAAEEAARRALEEASTVRLSVEDQRRFVELLLNPPGPTPARERARAAHEALISPIPQINEHNLAVRTPPVCGSAA